MANLKLDPELLIHRIGKAGDEAHDSVRRAVEYAKEEVAELSEILPELDRLAAPIVRDAVIAMAKTVVLQSGSGERPWMEFRMSGPNGGFAEHVASDGPIAPGKYRALFFLVPVDE